MKRILFILSLICLTACTNNQLNTKNPTSEEMTNETPTQSDNIKADEQDIPTDHPENNVVEEIDFAKFFMKDNSTAYFIGYGNEYATYTVHTKWLSDRYVALTENNGGAVMQKIYRITENNKVDLIYNEIVEDFPYEITYPTINELDNLSLIETFLNGPIEIGKVIGRWEIVQVETTVETPYQTFDDVFVLEETTDDFINRRYFVEGFGEIKRESIMHIGGDEEDFIVTSTLEKIDDGN